MNLKIFQHIFNVHYQAKYFSRDYFAEFLSQDAELAQGFDAEVSQTVERSVAEFTESGAGSEIEAGIDAGTELSQGGAIQRAGADSVAENTGNKYFNKKTCQRLIYYILGPSGTELRCINV